MPIRYPGTSMQELNLDWVLTKVKENTEQTEHTADELNAVSEEVTTLSGQLATTSGQVTTLSGQLATTSGQVTIVSGRVNSIGNELEDTQESIADTQAVFTGPGGVIYSLHTLPEGTYFWLNDHIAVTTVDVPSATAMIEHTNYEFAVIGDEITDLKSEITDITVTSITSFVDGYINASTGYVNPPTADAQKAADFIPVVNGATIIGTLHLSAAHYKSMNLNAYDYDKKFISRIALVDGGNGDTITINHTINNSSINYVRFSFSTYGDFDSFNVTVFNTNAETMTAVDNKIAHAVNPIIDLENIGYQYIDKDAFILGYYNWNGEHTDIQKNSAVQNWYCLYIENIPAGTYYYNKFFNTNFSFIRNLSNSNVQLLTDAGFQDTDNGTITINYPFSLYITCHDQLQDINNGMFSSKDLPVSYAYGLYKAPEWYVNSQGQTIWIVGNGYIPTIQEACNRASSNDIIFIKCGTYTEQVSIWNKKLHIIGEDKANTILIDHSGNYQTPPLEMSIGSLSNMTIIEDGSTPTGSGTSDYLGAYCLHIEWEPSQAETFNINNCDFINDIHAALGCGLYQDYTVHFKDCSFRCNASSEGTKERGSFYFHTRNAANCTNQHMIAENCVISSAGAKWAVLLGVPSGANNTGNATARFSGCTIWTDDDGTADSIAYFDTTGGSNVLSVVNSYGNTVAALNN